MIATDKKKAVSVILSRFKPDGMTQDGPEKMPEENIDADQEAKRAMAEEIMQAFHSKSTEALATALDAFVDHCISHHDQDDEE